jgi:DNA-binding NtrC family response regulator
VAPDGQKALRLLESFDPDVVLTDLKMPVMDGIALLEQGKPLVPHAAFVVMTAFGSIETAVHAIQRGADNYLTKPLDLDAVSALVLRACEKSKLSRETHALRRRLEERFAVSSILGEHPSMQRLAKTIMQVAPSRATVLIHGESGTGKELVARAIHYGGPRAKGPFAVVNCAAIPEPLLESELFGHVRGAFTGATRDKDGVIMRASGGTLFLDEVGDMPMRMQVDMLRVLQERRLRPVGGDEERAFDVRFIAASNRPLKALVAAGLFREDLYYRLSVVEISLPPLRERVDDVPLLCDHFLRAFAKRDDLPAKRLTLDAMRRLQHYHWPGNVRQLEHVLLNAWVLVQGDWIRGQDLSLEGSQDTIDAAVAATRAAKGRGLRYLLCRSYFVYVQKACWKVAVLSVRKSGSR